MSNQSPVKVIPGSRYEVMSALYPFILTGFILPSVSLLGRVGLLPVPGRLVEMVLFTLLALMGLLLIAGLALGLPRWSLPYLGFVAAILNVYVFFRWLAGPLRGLLSDLFDPTSLLSDIFLDGVFWFGLLITMALLVFVSSASTLFQRFQQDWTLLCFMLYGALPFVVWFLFDEHAGAEPYELLTGVVLASGAWSYLGSSHPQKRFWALFVAFTLAMFITAVGKAILIPAEGWSISVERGLVRSEVKHTIIMWAWLALIMLLPRLLEGVSETVQVLQVED